MNSKSVRALLGIGVIVVAIILLIILKDDGGDDNGSGDATTTAQSENGSEPGGKPSVEAVPTIVIKGGEPVGGVADLEFNAGEQIRFKVVSDISEEIHVHGYDIAKDVKAGGSVTFDFPATIEGIFEAELEGKGEQIAELRISP